jgi:hypothetical protein
VKFLNSQNLINSYSHIANFGTEKLKNLEV